MKAPEPSHAERFADLKALGRLLKNNQAAIVTVINADYGNRSEVENLDSESRIDGRAGYVLQHLKDRGVDLFLHQQRLDTSTTAGRAMNQMLGVAEFERGIIKERVNSGLARARANGTKLGRGNRKDGKASKDKKRWGKSTGSYTRHLATPQGRHGDAEDWSRSRCRHRFCAAGDQ